MDFEQAAILIGSLLGGGGIVALVKARSDIRNANKSVDIKALQDTIKSQQESIQSIQDRYQEIIEDTETRCKKLSDRLQFLEAEYVMQTQRNNESVKRITDLEIELKKANSKIEFLENELRKKDIMVMRLEQENVELRKQSNHLGLMEK